MSMTKEREPRKLRYEHDNPVLQTRVPQHVHDRIKGEARDRKMSLSQYLQSLVAEHEEVSTEIAHYKEQWKRDGWIECAGWMLANFGPQAFCNIDLKRFKALLAADPQLWPKILESAEAHGESKTS